MRFHLFLVLVTLLAFVTLSCHAYTSAFKVKKLNEQIKKSGNILDLDSRSFDLYTEPGRTYSIVILLTAMSSEHACEVCRAFHPEFELTAQSYYSSDAFKADNVYFGVLDFKNGREIYSKLRLNTAPTVIHFPPTEGPNFKPTNPAQERYDFGNGLTAEDFSGFVEGVVGARIPIRRPINYQYYAFMGVFFVLLAVVAKVAYKLVLPIFQSSHFWSILSIMLILLFTSGHMWNHIRKPPYVGAGQGNRPMIYAPGFQQQFGLESQIIAILYGATSLAFVFLVQKAPALKDPTNQRAAIYLCLAGFVVLFSLLLSVFRIKNGGYPFKLLF